MVKQVYSVRDSKAEVFGTPITFLTEAEAIRGLKTAINNPTTMYNSYPEDYDLYHIGSFDDSTGKFKLLDAPKHIVHCVQLKDAQRSAEVQ